MFESDADQYFRRAETFGVHDSIDRTVSSGDMLFAVQQVRPVYADSQIFEGIENT